ncbi:MAG: sulfatase [Candidatus Aminicenantes bacterium]|nr:sulfatase [Candidatus Aminicenantes bacterium]
MTLFCSHCGTESRVDDLIEESRLTYDRTEYFFHDYMIMPDGYGMVENLTESDGKSIRRGRFPGTKIAFQLERARTLRLLFNAKPNLKTRAVCSGLTMRLNSGKAVQIALPEQGTGLVKLDLMPGELKPGRNEIDIRYDFSSPQQQQLAKSVSGIFLPVAFSRLIITSLENPLRQREVRKAADLMRAIREKKDPRGFGALLPGGRTYYVHLTGSSRLQGECRFVPVSFAKRTGKDVKIRVFLQQHENAPEETAAELTIPADRKFHSIHAELGEREGLTRLRLSFHREDSNKAVEGVVEFSSLGIRHKVMAPQRAADSARNTERVARLQERLRSLNTIVLLFDSARADHFSAYGYSRPTTPAMERFAEGATVFSRFYSETLTTRCSVSTLFTGYPLPITGVYHVFSRLPRELDTLAERLNRKGILTKAVNGMGNIASEFGFNRGFDHYHELLKEPGFSQLSQEYLPHLLPWLEKKRDERFFLYVHFKEPHSPYVPVAEFQGLFSRPFKTGVSVENSDESQEKARLSPERVRYIEACYDETLASADSVFAEIHAKLKQLDLLRNSMVMIIADHGEYLGEKNVFGHGISFHEPGIHVPFILHLPPDIAAKFPRRVDSMVKMTDIFRTLSDIYGLSRDPDQNHGRNFLYSLFDPEAEINDFVFLAKRGTPGHCVIDGRYKLIMFENGIRELYDLDRDADEMRNLYHEKWFVSRYLERRMIAWLDHQQIIRARLIPIAKDQTGNGVKVHEKTLENLRSLGYL